MYKLVNNVLGWLTFFVAAFVYCSTIDTLMKTSADSLKKSADALNDASLWEKKKIKKKDEKTGEETEACAQIKNG